LSALPDSTGHARSPEDPLGMLFLAGVQPWLAAHAERQAGAPCCKGLRSVPCALELLALVLA